VFNPLDHCATPPLYRLSYFGS